MNRSRKLRQPAEQLIAVRREPVIDPRVPLVLVVDLVRGPAVVVGGPGRGGQRIPLQQRQRHRIACGSTESCCPETASRDRPGGRRRVVDDRHPPGDRLGEDALPLQQRSAPSRSPCGRSSAAVPGSPTKKNVRSRTIGPPSVPPNWLRRYSGLTALADWKKFRAFSASWRKNSNAVPWKCVRAGLGRQVDDAAVEPAELGGRAVAFDLELLDRVDRPGRTRPGPARAAAPRCRRTDTRWCAAGRR